MNAVLLRRPILFASAVFLLLVVVAGIALIYQRQDRCASVPFLGDELLSNAALAPAAASRMPEGWSSIAGRGVELRGKAIGGDPKQWGFDLDGDGRSLQLIGIANAVLTPPIIVQGGLGYCFAGQALTDSDKQSTTRMRVVFDWRDATGITLATSETPWQPVVLWHDGLANWSPVVGSFRAPPNAATLQIRLEPSSDDRIYLDGMHVRQNIFAPAGATVSQPGRFSVRTWPNGTRAAVAFTFDWETAMGGLIHTRSNRVDDPNSGADWQVRAHRMREGVTTTLNLFRARDIRATYYATGYNFLQGNTERRTFMGNPTYAWAKPENGWSTDWSGTPWFAKDPYGTIDTDPNWYFGDLIPVLQRAKQDIQSHTFAHFSGSYAKKEDWQADFDAWHEVAKEAGVAPATSLAFPWSSSNGMSDDDWNTLSTNGITSVTRVAWSLPQYALFPKNAQGIPDDPQCRPVPGHETILACPDFYLRDGSAITATTAIDRAIAVGGMIDLWAHTEEVTTPSQIATWTQAVSYATWLRDAGQVWIAPLPEIAARQRAMEKVSVRGSIGTPQPNEPQRITVNNRSDQPLDDVTVQLPFTPARAEGGARILPNDLLVLPAMPANSTMEVVVWPA